MEPGQYTINMAEYLALDMLSSGICHTLLSESPAHARYRQMHPEPSTNAMDLGTIVHQVLLEGSTNGIAVFDPADFPNADGKGAATGWTNKSIRIAREAARAEGKTPILAEDMITVMAMAHEAMAYIAKSELAGIFDRGKPEQTLIWQEGSLWCKARPDWFTDDHRTIVHVKTTSGSAEPSTFIRGPLVSFGYDVAAAFYERGLHALFGYRPPAQSRFLIQETHGRYECSMIGLGPAKMEIAMGKVTHALAVWGECLASGHWPAYPTQAVIAEPTPWEINQMADNALAWHDQELYETLIEMTGGLR